MISEFLISLFLASSVHAGEGPLPRFAVDTATDSRPACRLVSLADDGILRIDQAMTKLVLPRFISMRQEGVALPPFLRRDFVLLTNGDRLPLDPSSAASIADTRLNVWPDQSLSGIHGKALPLYLPNVVLLFWTLPDGNEDADLFFTKLAQEPRKRDVAYLQNGDRVEGTVTALGGKIGCQVTTADRKIVTIAWPKLAGIAFNTDRQARLRTKYAYTRAVLAGGARVNFTELRFEEVPRRWIGKTQFGATLDLPEADVLALDVRQGQAVALSDLAPIRYEHRPYLGLSWPLVRDAAVTGHALRSAGSTFEKGLGMHAPAEVAYKLDGQYLRFDCQVGLDEAITRRGRARLAVKLDGKRVDLNDGKEVTSRDAPLSLRLDVRNVRELTLIVDVGTFGDVQAHVNWAGARLIKRE